jgi:uncharacterized membrane protein
MNPTLLLASTSLGVAALIAVISVPMIYRRIPMNHYYGARFKASFKSEKNWYEINEYSGKVLLIASLPIAACGIAGFFIQDRNPIWYVWTATGVQAVSVMIAAYLSYRKAQLTDKTCPGGVSS